MPSLGNYAVITPARSEAQLIELTIRSMISQSRFPLKWIIVSDGSTDETEAIVNASATHYSWIGLVVIPETRNHNFAGRARAFNEGLSRVGNLTFDAIACLDADISFDADYFEWLLDRMTADSTLGVVGTSFQEPARRGYDYRFTSIEHVSGGCKLIRRACFDEIAGYVPLAGGGIDMVAVVTARMKGWKTETSTDRSYLHHRPINSAMNRGLRIKFELGTKGLPCGRESALAGVSRSLPGEPATVSCRRPISDSRLSVCSDNKRSTISFRRFPEVPGQGASATASPECPSAGFAMINQE